MIQEFYKTGEKNVFKKSSQNCFPTQGYTKSIPNIELGFYKPLSEKCPLITGQLSKGPDRIINSISME